MGRLIYGTFAFFPVFLRFCVALLNLCDYDTMNPSKPLHCRIEQESFLDSENYFRFDDSQLDSTNLTVIEYNIDKNGYGGDG